MNSISNSRPAWRLVSILVLMMLLLAACNRAPVTETPLSVQTQPAGEPQSLPNQVLKIAVAQAGMVELTGQELKKAGFPLDQIPAENLRLTWRGQIVPLWQEGEGNQLRLRFYAQAPDSAYVPQSVFLLQAAPLAEDNRRMLVAAAAPVDGAPVTQTYSATLHLEQNLIYSPQVEEGDHWLWQLIPAPRSQSFEITLSAPEADSATLRLAVWSSNSAPQNPDHHLRLLVNGQQVLDQTWDGIGNQLLTAAIPAGVLQAGTNEIKLDFPGDTGAAVDLTNLNWIELVYPRRLSMAEDQLIFGATAAGSMLVEGVDAKAVVFDVTDPLAVQRLSEIDLSSGAVRFQGGAEQHYAIINPKGYQKAVSLELAVTQPDLTQLPVASYVAIGPAALLVDLQPLLDLRASQGLSVQAVPLEAVVDQFGAGYLEPEALRNFLRHTAKNWPAAPEYVLLVGDATYDPLGYTAPKEANQLPSYFVFTNFGGQTGTDLPYADLDDDNFPDLALGRLPARTPAQVQHFVQKVLLYEQAAPAAEQRVLAVADGQEAGFRVDAEGFLQQLPTGYVTELYAPSAGAQDAAQQIQAYLDQEYALVSYFGHGSINMWGKDRLFMAEQAAQLKNTTLPIFMTMTCLNGLYIHPKVESLTEALLWAENGGAVSVLAPTSLTTAYDQTVLRQPFVDGLFNQKLSLGKALLAAQRQTLKDFPNVREVVETFILFGDPALKLK